jgi:hypothetical protein
MRNYIKAFLATALIVLASPAAAGVTQIVGSGTGGNIGTNTAASGTTLIITTNVTVPSGSLIVVGMGLRAATLWTTCVDSAANTYTLSSKLGAAGASGALAWSYTANSLASGGTITCTSGASTAAKGATAAAFTGVNSTPRDAASAAPTNGTSTTPTVGPTGTLSCPAGGNCEVLIGFYITLATVNTTEDAAFTSLGSTTANASNTHMAFKFATTNAAVTYAPTNATSGAWIANLDAYIGDGVGGASAKNRSLIGVGN